MAAEIVELRSFSGTGTTSPTSGSAQSQLPDFQQSITEQMGVCRKDHKTQRHSLAAA